MFQDVPHVISGDSARGAAARAVGFQIGVALERLLGSGLRPARNRLRRRTAHWSLGLWHGDIEERLRRGEVHGDAGNVAKMPDGARRRAPERSRSRPQTRREPGGVWNGTRAVAWKG